MIIARLTTVRMSLSLLVNGQAEYFRSKGYTYYLASGPSSHIIDDKFYSELPLVRRPNIYKDLKALFATYLWLRKIKPDILHTHTPKAGLIGMMAGFFAGVPTRLHTVAGIPWLESTGLVRLLYRLVEFTTYIFATKIYPNSHGLHQILIDEIPLASKKYKVLGCGSSNGIDLNYFSSEAIKESKFDLRNYYGLAHDTFVWLFIGRIVKEKGIIELVTAFLKLTGNHTLLLVGPFEDDQDPITEETRIHINTNPNIHFFGFQNDVRPFIKVSDVLVFPSYREGFPNVPLQVAAMGLPQIVTNINGCNEIVISKINGLIVPPKDVEGLSLAMSQIFEDNEMRLNMAMNARSSISTAYSRENIWKLIEDEYKYFFKN